jgi:hypothetical protein
MSTAREFLDFLTDLFATEAKMENVVRSLQQDHRIAIGGRGRSAHQITVEEAALIVIAYAASLKAIDAARRLKKIEGLRGSSGRFSEVMFAILRGKLSVSEIRISRTQAYAEVRYPNGDVERFSKGNLDLRGRFRVEASLDHQLLFQIAEFMAKSDGSY